MPSIDIAANTRAAQSQVKDLSKALDDVSDALDDAARDGDKAADKLERSFRDMVRASEKTQQDVSADAKRAGRDLEREYRDGADTAGRSLSTVGDRSREVSDEFRQNLGETFSSFRGDLKDLPQIAQDTLGGLAGSGALGGIPGLAATAAGAAGLGLIIGAIENIDAEQQKVKERANDLAQAYIDAGSRVLDVVTLTSRVTNVLTDPTTREEAEKLKDTLGVELPDAARIMAGDSNALAIAYELVKQKQADLNAQKQAGQAANAQEVIDWQNAMQATDNATAALDHWAGINQYAATTADAVTASLMGMIGNYDTATEAVDEFGNKLYTLPDGKQVLIDAETGQASFNVSKFRGDLDGQIPTVKTVDIVANDKATSVIDGIVNRRRTVDVDVRYRGQGGTTWY